VSGRLSAISPIHIKLPSSIEMTCFAAQTTHPAQYALAWPNQHAVAIRDSRSQLSSLQRTLNRVVPSCLIVCSLPAKTPICCTEKASSPSEPTSNVRVPSYTFLQVRPENPRRLPLLSMSANAARNMSFAALLEDTVCMFCSVKVDKTI
jgi:hypothetical protein